MSDRRRVGLAVAFSVLAWALAGSVVSAQTPPACSARADGGPSVVDRGIGGTGALADRGIGGTGAPVSLVGLRGRITGFGSVCVNGVEVELPADVRVMLDGRPAGVGELRVGFVAAMATEAAADGGVLTRMVSVGHEVIGPVEQTGARMVVAGQTVTVGAGTAVAEGIGRGDWLAVSGLRGPGGAIFASRIDRAPAGRVLVSGDAVRVGGGLRIGGLALQGAELALAGRRVVAEGVYGGAFMRVDRMLTVNALSGAIAGHFVLEAMANRDGSVLRTGEGLTLPIAAGVAVELSDDQPVLLMLAVSRDGAVTVESAREAGREAGAAAGHVDVAPAHAAGGKAAGADKQAGGGPKEAGGAGGGHGPTR